MGTGLPRLGPGIHPRRRRAAAPGVVIRCLRLADQDRRAAPIRFHDLRHTHASLGLAAGVPIKVMSERLGHSSSNFTADAYQHVTPALEEQAASTVARLVFGS
jgi:integrase